MAHTSAPSRSRRGSRPPRSFVPSRSAAARHHRPLPEMDALALVGRHGGDRRAAVWLRRRRHCAARDQRNERDGRALGARPLGGVPGGRGRAHGRIEPPLCRGSGARSARRRPLVCGRSPDSRLHRQPRTRGVRLLRALRHRCRNRLRHLHFHRREVVSGRARCPGRFRNRGIRLWRRAVHCALRRRAHTRKSGGDLRRGGRLRASSSSRFVASSYGIRRRAGGHRRSIPNCGPSTSG